MSSGWIKLYRQSLDNKMFRHDWNAWHIFTALLLLVDRTGKYECGRFQLADITGIKPTTCYSALRRLENAKMITQESNNKFTEISIINWIKYQQQDDNKNDNKMTTTQQQDDNKMTLNKKGRKEERQESKKLIILHTNADAFGNQINELIKLFGNLNPSYEQLFKRKNQREAASRLLEKYGLEKIKEMVETLVKIKNDKFSPTVITPCQLEDKMGLLVSYFQKTKLKIASFRKENNE